MNEWNLQKNCDPNKLIWTRDEESVSWKREVKKIDCTFFTIRAFYCR